MSFVSLPELAVMQSAAELIAPLGASERARVAAWLMQYVADGSAIDDADADADAPVSEIASQEAPQPAIEEPSMPATFADFYAGVAPKTAWQRAATAAYWLETREDTLPWRTSAVTKLLKSIEEEVKQLSITIATKSKGDKPVFDVMSKSGDSMQARKTYRLAEAGKAYVEGRL